MAGPILEMPDGISDQLRDALAAFQVWSGKADGFGKWNDPLIDNSFLRPDADNVLTFSSASPYPAHRMSYTIIGNTMLLNVNLSNMSYTSNTASNLIAIKLPDGYRVVADATSGSFVGRGMVNPCYLITGASSQMGRMNGRSGRDELRIQTTSGNFATGTVTVNGQIVLEVVRP